MDKYCDPEAHMFRSFPVARPLALQVFEILGSVIIESWKVANPVDVGGKRCVYLLSLSFFERNTYSEGICSFVKILSLLSPSLTVWFPSKISSFVLFSMRKKHEIDVNLKKKSLRLKMRDVICISFYVLRDESTGESLVRSLRFFFKILLLSLSLFRKKFSSKVSYRCWEDSRKTLAPRFIQNSLLSLSFLWNFPTDGGGIRERKKLIILSSLCIGEERGAGVI